MNEKKQKKPEKQQEKKTPSSNSKFAVGTRGRIFEGHVVKKFPKRVVIEAERTLFIPKYERFLTRKTRVHARLQDNMDINVGDYVKARECRPLSKITHHIVVEKVKSAEEKK